MRYQTLVSCEQLLAHLADPRWIVIDCRFSLTNVEAGRQAHLAGHIPGAHYAHLDADLSGPVTAKSGRHPLPDADVLCRRLGAWGITPQSQVVVYDDAGGAMAARLWWLLRWLGHAGVAVLDGGWPAWQARGLPQNQVQPVRLASNYPGRPQRQMWLSADEVRHGLDMNSIALVDARAAPRFRGEVEPIDSIAGHVPGALNRPLELNLDRHGQFKKAALLRAEFARLLPDRQAAEVVQMCGSGVTACHNLLAMELAGLSGSRLYPGSWSEWIRSLDRPMEIGC